MYWSDWPPGLTGKETTFDSASQEKGIIESAWLDGSNRAPFVQHSQKGRLFWCDSYLQTLESVNIESGSDRTTHLSNDNNPGIVSRPYGLSLHNNLLFWSEFEKGQIMQLNLNNNDTTLVKEENPQLFSLKVFDKEKQPDLIGHSCVMSACQVSINLNKTSYVSSKKLDRLINEYIFLHWHNRLAFWYIFTVKYG